VPTLPHAIQASSRLHASLPAIVTENGDVITYQQLEHRVADVARALIGHGISPGDRVAVWAPNSADWIVIAIAVQRAGAVLVPMNTRFKEMEAQHVLRASGARLLVTVSGFLGADYPAMVDRASLPELREVVVLREHADANTTSWWSFLTAPTMVSCAEADERLQSLTPNDACDIIFTSGTTGRPKGVVTCHGQNLRQYTGYSAALGLSDADRYLIVNPFFHTFGYKAGWLSALLRGATCYPMAVFDPVRVLALIERARITVLPGPPTLFQRLLAEDYATYERSSLRLSITGSSSVPLDLVRRMRDELGFTTVLTAYGLTESCGVVTMCRPTDALTTIAGTAGRPIEGVELAIVDDAGGRCPAGVAGEVLVRGYCVMKGYHNDPDATAKAVDANGWLHTGDMAVADQEGNIAITDRKTEMYIVGGMNCYPAEVERLMLSHPDIDQCAVIGVSDELYGEVGRAFVVPRHGAELTAPRLTEWARATMSNYKVPRGFEICSSLPVNAAGKIDKVVLRRLAAVVSASPTLQR
jgi:acyl-CoA synthetase (AMP-forming)/AMP-acid ligase II